MSPRRRPGPSTEEIVAACPERVVGVATLEALGVPRTTIAYRCRAGGPWTRMGSGVVRLGNGPQTRDDRCRAGLVHAGPGAVVTGADALVRHSVRAAPVPSGPVHVLVPSDRRRIGSGLVIAERTERLPPAVGQVPLAPVARAALDLARRSRDRNLVRAVFAGAVQHGHCGVGDLVRELVDGCNRGSALPREVLREIVGGARSVAEATASGLVRRAGLPPPSQNVRLELPDGRFLAIPDFWFDEAGLAWEIDSLQFHLAPADYERTVRRRSALVAAGVVVVQSLPSDLRTRSSTSCVGPIPRRLCCRARRSSSFGIRPEPVPRPYERVVRTNLSYERPARANPGVSCAAWCVVRKARSCEPGVSCDPVRRTKGPLVRTPGGVRNPGGGGADAPRATGQPRAARPRASRAMITCWIWLVPS
ncbi:hypothetical protein [Pseudonocardia sp. ICBG1293]|uniref:hypothetical protein n=1 Tax=Pseudonocardia sp. ICBG1293 TaxID=2844382 RepID=UPI001CCB19A3|nr:hypothetical protein [Pseudonocardia sp. ICBG1293]